MTTHRSHSMTRLPVDVTHELSRAIRHCCDTKYRPMGPLIEEWLWSIPEVAQAAKELGITREPRPYVGQQRRRPA